jgi:peptide/nickel transport system ATP-binding protein
MRNREVGTKHVFAGGTRLVSKLVKAPKGEIPDPINPPSGCAFHPRCALATDICRSERPKTRRIGGTTVACHLAE